MADIHAVATEPQGEIAEGAAATLRVVLVNNMADAALATTERRFQRLVQAACPDVPLDFRCVTLPQIPRGEMAAARIARHYASLDEMLSSPPDAVLFSGAEPVCRSLRDELFWPGLAALCDWVRDENIPSLFSCLAAHAAVLHYAGIERRRLPRKLLGIYTQSIQANHALLHGMPQNFQVPHSRWNDVSAADLTAKGYHILTKGAHTGVDMFVPDDGTPHIFLQGHPEYEENAVFGEYNRDLKRFESGHSAYKPTEPKKEDGGGSALGGAAYSPLSSPQVPRPPGISLSGFENVIRNWIQHKKEMVA